ncbi:MAG TPA: hypothetical protein VN969_46825 [Streptosporangiaceae bacterium]|nr:hypothetical protein [Streptosporangiaceae bacterium]
MPVPFCGRGAQLAALNEQLDRVRGALARARSAADAAADLP